MKFLNHTSILLVALSMSSAHAAGMEGMQDMPGMPGMMKDSTKASKDQIHKGKGTIESIDRNKRAIILNHQPIKSMGWPAMTMAFSVKEGVSLDKLAPGQTVDFEFVRAPDGRYSITRMVQAETAKSGKQRSENSPERMMGGMMGMMDACSSMMQGEMMGQMTPQLSSRSEKLQPQIQTEAMQKMDEVAAKHVAQIKENK
jgi:Cu(I)/Ag(I) efflux system periplasmic protein CusF